MLEKLFKQLDETRLALHHNFMAYDDDLEETYSNFIEELNKLERLIKKVN